jgi:hypothetical protein
MTFNYHVGSQDVYPSQKDWHLPIRAVSKDSKDEILFRQEKMLLHSSLFSVHGILPASRTPRKVLQGPAGGATLRLRRGEVGSGDGAGCRGGVTGRRAPDGEGFAGGGMLSWRRDVEPAAG